MIATTSILNGINADFGDVEKVLSKYEDTLSRGSVDLYDSLQMAQELENKLTQIIADFTTLRQDEQYKQFMEILNKIKNPETEETNTEEDADTKEHIDSSHREIVLDDNKELADDKNVIDKSEVISDSNSESEVKDSSEKTDATNEEHKLSLTKEEK